MVGELEENLLIFEKILSIVENDLPESYLDLSIAEALKREAAFLDQGNLDRCFLFKLSFYSDATRVPSYLELEESWKELFEYATYNQHESELFKTLFEKLSFVETLSPLTPVRRFIQAYMDVYSAGFRHGAASVHESCKNLQ